MRACWVLVITLVAVLILAETSEAKKRKGSRDDVVDPDAATGEGHESTGRRRHGDRQHGKERKGKKERGRHHGDQTEKDVMVGFDDIVQDDQTVDATPTEGTDPEEPQMNPEEEPQEEPMPPKKGRKKGHRGEKAGGANPDKAARRAAKQERLQHRREKQAEKEERKEGKAARKEARKEAKRGEKRAEKTERKQARKEARRMERQNMTSDCSEHSDCPTGSCCQQRGPIQRCRAFNRAEGSMCFADCVCAEGLECFIREGKQAKHPDGDAKGRCRSTAVEEPADVPAEEETAQDEE